MSDGDERNAITSAVQRLLAGKPLRSSGALTIVALAEEAGLRRNKLTRKHTDLKDLFYADVKARGGVPVSGIKLREQITALEARVASLRQERDDYRSAAETFARAVHVLTVENDALRKGASAPFIDAVARLEVWESGRDAPLWAIHELDRIDKHRLLLSVAITVTSIGLYGDSYELAVVKKYSGMEADGPMLLEPRELTPLEEGHVIFGPLSDFRATEAAFGYDVILKGPAMLRGKTAATWLRILADRAEKIINDLAPLA